MGRKRRPLDLKTYSGRFAARVVQLREERGFTVEQLAERLHVSIQMIYRWESATQDVPADAYPRLAKVLGCETVHDLLPAR